jgi:NADH:ubiquinone oxidoreductase subunit F (NADH-binding)
VTACPRLLGGWQETGRAAGLGEHLERYGGPPVPTSRGDRQQLIGDVTRSGLTGRGGAAFPAARKLAAVAAASGPAVVVANGMESEPASRKDETLLALAPHLVLDGMAVAAAAVGAREVHLCLSRRRPRQIQRIEHELRQREQAQLDRLPVLVHALPGNYVSSEETSLVQWLNGGDARPARTPPRPFERGVAKLPTLVGNVETFAHLALIARYGPEWFQQAGTDDAPGTALVTLAGPFTRPGVYEVGLGAGLREIMDLGAPQDFRAVLLGGFQGGWLPAPEALALRYSPAAAREAGAALGPGLIMPLPADGCGLAETARVLEYLAEQSAGQCGPCRFGLPAVASDFADLAWQPAAIRGNRLRERIGLLAGRGACKHPDGAARLAASALRTFADEVRRHRAHGPCAAARASARTPVPAGAGAARPGVEWQ